MDKKTASIMSAANAISLAKLRGIADRLQAGKEPSVREAAYAQKFTRTVSLVALTGWLEQLRDAMEFREDWEKVNIFIDNLRKE